VHSGQDWQPASPERLHGSGSRSASRKGRGIHWEDAKPFEARLDIREGKAAWSMKDVEDAVRSRVAP
jgi:hypothetical protein